MSERIEGLSMSSRAKSKRNGDHDRASVLSQFRGQLVSLSPQAILLQPFLSPTDKRHLLLNKDIASQIPSLYKFFDTLAYQAKSAAEGQVFCRKLLQLKENIRVVHGNRLAKIQDMLKEIRHEEGMITERNELLVLLETAGLKRRVHEEVRQASYDWKALDTVQKMEAQDPTLEQFGLPESSMLDITELTVDVSCLLENMETVTSFSNLLSRTGPGLARLNLISSREDYTRLENNKLARDLGEVLRQATSTSIRYLRLSQIEDTVLYNMTSRQKTIRTFQPNKLVRYLCFQGKQIPKAFWICPSPSYWIMPRKKKYPVSGLQELVLEYVNISHDTSAVCLLNFLLDHQPSLRKLTLRHCRLHGGAHRYLALLLQDELNLVEDITMASLFLCRCRNEVDSQQAQQKLLDKTFQRILKQQQRQLRYNEERSSSSKSTASPKPKKSLKRVVIRDVVPIMRAPDAVSDFCDALGRNSSLTDLTLLHRTQRTRAFRALLGFGSSTGCFGATSMISSLKRLDIQGERSKDWIGELTKLVSNPQSVLESLTVHIGHCPNEDSFTLQYRSNPSEVNALDDYFEGLRCLVKNGLQGHSTLEKLNFKSELNHGTGNSELLTELGILLEAFTHPLTSTERGQLHSFRHEVWGIHETDPELLDIFRYHFCPPRIVGEESRVSMLEDIQIGGASGPRSLGIQHHALRVLMRNTMHQALWGRPISDGHPSSSDSSLSLWPIVLGGLLKWRDNPVAQSMGSNEREQLFLSGIFWSILESPSRMIQELESAGTIWEGEEEESVTRRTCIDSFDAVPSTRCDEFDDDVDVDVDGYQYRRFWYTHSPL